MLIALNLFSWIQWLWKRQEEKLEHIDDLSDQLKEKHDTKYNVMQYRYRTWAEMIDAGRHSSP